MNTISIVVNTLNEEKALYRLLVSVESFADEIVVVDMHSEDGCVDVAKKFGAKVYLHEKVDYVEPARNFGIAKATSDWVLILDPDEEVSRTLGNKLKSIVMADEVNYCAIPRKNIIFGKWMKHSRWWPDYNVRFFKKGKVKWSDTIHSIPETHGKGLDLPIDEKFAIDHYHYDTVEQYVERMNRYTTQHATNLKNEGYKFNWKDIVRKPSGEFFSRYFFGEGYKDGLHGLALASLQSFSELVLYLKVWQGERFSQKDLKLESVLSEMRSVDSDRRYWYADSLYKKSGSNVQKLKRKFKLP